MKQIFTFLATVLVTVATYGQVGIGTVTPKTTLQVVGDPTNTSVPDGIQAPSITLAQLDAKIASYTSVQDGAIIYVSDVSVASTKTETAGITAKGFYYYENATDLWKPIGGSGPIYGSSMVLQNSASASTDSQINLPGLSFRWNNSKLEIKGESNNAPQALIFYFSYHVNTNTTINFRPNTVNGSYGDWLAVDDHDDSWGNLLPLITGSYAVYEFDFSVYPLAGKHIGKTYNIKIFLGGWGDVSMRASYQ